jgi:hypothetical protein
MNRIILVILVVFILLNTGVFAIKQVEPYSRTISNLDLVGRSVPNSTLELVFSKENDNYDSLVMLNNLPENFGFEIKQEFESFKVIINVPDSALNGQYKLNLRFFNSQNLVVDEKIEVYFSVDDSLLFVSMDNFSQTTLVNFDALYTFALINNSDSEAEFVINSSLPNSWFSSRIVRVSKKEIHKEIIIITPRINGLREFEFFVDYSGMQKKFDVLIKAEPTIESKFSAVLNGLPFYSFSLIPNYFFNGILSLFF